MKKEGLDVMVQELKSGRIIYTEDKAYAYTGDVFTTSVRYDQNKDRFLWELNQSTAEGNQCIQSRHISLEKCHFYLANAPRY